MLSAGNSWISLSIDDYYHCFVANIILRCSLLFIAMLCITINTTYSLIATSHNMHDVYPTCHMFVVAQYNQKVHLY